MFVLMRVTIDMMLIGVREIQVLADLFDHTAILVFAALAMINGFAMFTARFPGITFSVFLSILF